MSAAPLTASASTRKPLALVAVGEAHRADAERARNGGDEAAERLGVERPDLRGDRAALAGRDAQQAGLRRRRARQRVEPIVRRGLDLAQQDAAERRELAIERQAGEMRADRRDLDAARAKRAAATAAGPRRRARSRPSVAPEWTWTCAAIAREKAVSAGRADQRQARRQAVAAHAGGRGDGAEIEQVDEIGVGPEVRIEPDRIGLDLGDGIGARHRRDRHDVERRPGGRRPAAQGRQLVRRLEGARRRRTCARPR